MYNLIRSINYSSRRNLAVLITIFAMATLPVLLPLVLMDIPMKELTGGNYYVYILGDMMGVFIFAIMILSCIVSSGDAGDRTINYEILAGNGRGRIFAARALNAILWGAGLTGFFLYLPLVYYGIINGWPFAGLKVSDIILRCLLSLLPLIRFSAFFIMLSTLFRSAGKGIGFGFLILEVASIVYELICEFVKGFKGTWLMGMYSAFDLIELTNSREYVIDGETVTVYETALTSEKVVPAVIAAILMTAVYLSIAAWDFKKRDR